MVSIKCKICLKHKNSTLLNMMRLLRKKHNNKTQIKSSKVNFSGTLYNDMDEKCKD